MASDPLRVAVNELGTFFGARSADAYLQQIFGSFDTDVQSPPNTLVTTTESSMAVLINDLNGQSDSIPSMDDILKRISEMVAGDAAKLAQVNRTLCITVANDAVNTDPASHPLNAPKVVTPDGDDESQGMFKPSFGDTYTVSDYYPTEFWDDTTTSAKLHVMQVFPAVANVSNADADVVSLFLNSVPTLEMSRAVPFIDILVLVRGDPADQTQTREVSLGRFLLGSDMSKESQMTQAMFTSEDASLSTEGTEEDQGHRYLTAANMEIFTSPQTLVPTNFDGTIRSNVDEGPLDPFRPLLSLSSFHVNVLNNHDMMSYTGADMTMVLHDRSQLGSVAPLVSPSGVGRVRMEITYGWSHPDGTASHGGQPANSSRQADVDSNRFGDLIDGMRVSELYRVNNTDFSFGDDGSVTINLKLSTESATEVQTVDVTMPEVTSAYTTLAHMTATAKNALSKFRKSGKKAGSVNIPLYVQRATNADSAAVMKTADIKKLKAFLKKHKVMDLKLIGGFIKDLAAARRGVVKSQELAITKMIRHLKNSPDPYLRNIPTPDFGAKVAKVGKAGGGAPYVAFKDAREAVEGPGVGTSYASFGKVLSYFVGGALSTSLSDEFHEVQMIFYAFNESASFLQDCNIAQFPINLDDLQRQLKNHFDKVGRMSIRQLVAFLNRFYLTDESQVAYGFDTVYQGRRKAGEASAKVRKDVKKDAKAEDTTLAQITQDLKQTALKTAYGLTDSPGQPSATFQLPLVSLKLEARKAKGDPSKSILRIQVFDQKCSSTVCLRSVLEGFIDNGTCPEISRKPDPDCKRGTRHGEIYKSHLEFLSSDAESVIQSAEDIDPKGKLGDISPEDLAAALKGMYVINVTDLGRLRETFAKLFPSIIYGGLNTGIISAKVASENNPGLATLGIVAQAENNPGASGVDHGLPQSVTPISLTLETFGCPLFAIGQHLFVDFQTNTTADNFYAVVGVDHTLEPGQFTSSVRLVTMSSFGKWKSTLDDLKEFVTAAARAATEVK